MASRLRGPLQRLARRRYSQVATSGKLDKQAGLLRDEGWDVTAFELDQGDEKSILALRDRVLHFAGRVHGLINNAVLRTMKSWQNSAEDFAKSMQVNATGIFLMTRAFCDHMAQQGGGSVVNIGSIQGMVGPDFSLYQGLGLQHPAGLFFPQRRDDPTYSLRRIRFTGSKNVAESIV